MKIRRQIRRTLSYLTIILLPLTTQAQIEATGRVEGRVGLLPGSGDESGNLVHMERVSLGVQQQVDFLSSSYRIAGGGLYRGSQELEFSEFVPEYDARVQFVPVGGMQVELFSFSQLRNPMQISLDTLQHREQVSGIQLQSALPFSGRILAAYGSRSGTRNARDFENAFIKLQVEQKLLGMQVRLRGERDLYSAGVSAPEEDRSNISLQWYGSPLKGLSWTSLNSLYRHDGHDYWRIYQRMTYQLSVRSTLWSHIRNEQVAYRGTYLNTRSYDIDYRWKLNKPLVLQLLTEGSKVKPLSGDPLYHWRATLVGLHWRLGGQAAALGVLQAGYKESYRFGSGLSLRYELEERLPLLRNRTLRIDLRDYSQGEYFKASNIDGADPRYDIDHELRLNLDLWPGRTLQLGNTFKLLNHFGTDLDFSSDTLRNALTHNIQLKYVHRRLRASLDHLTINEMGDNSDLRLHVNTRLSYNLSPGRSLNLMSMYRYQSDLYPDYLWLTSFIKINLRYFNWALEVQAQGHPDQVFEDNMAIWMRFVRQL